MSYLDPPPQDTYGKTIYFVCGFIFGFFVGAGAVVWQLGADISKGWFLWTVLASAVGCGLCFGFLSVQKGEDFWQDLASYLRWPWW